MNLKIHATGVILTLLCFAAPIRAENPDHVRRLLATKECSKCDLSRADLSGVDLSFAILIDADLREANLKGANLSNADLTRANLSQTDFSQANLNQAYLTNANLDRSILIGASLNNVRGLPIINPLSRQLTSLPPLPRKIRSLPPLPKIPPSLVIPKGPLPVPQTFRIFRTQPLLPPLIPQSLENNPTSQQPANIYPPKLVQAFLSSCTKTGGAAIEQICVCSIKKFQNEYTLEQFLEITLDLAEGGEPPETVTRIAVECAFNNQASF